MKKIRLILISFSLIAFTASAASAFIVLDNTAGGTKHPSAYPFQTTNHSISSTTYRSFSFTTGSSPSGSSWLLDSVTTALYSLNTVSRNVTWSLYETTATSPLLPDPTQLLHTKTVNNFTLPGSVSGDAAYVSFTLGWNVLFNHNYALVISVPTGSSNITIRNYTNIADRAFDPTKNFTFGANGVNSGANDSWVQMASANRLMPFELTATAVPEPSTYILLGLSLGVIAAVRRKMAPKE